MAWAMAVKSMTGIFANTGVTPIANMSSNAKSFLLMFPIVTSFMSANPVLQQEWPDLYYQDIADETIRIRLPVCSFLLIIIPHKSDCTPTACKIPILREVNGATRHPPFSLKPDQEDLS